MIRSKYRSRISGPLLDRFDLIVRVGRVDAGEYAGPPGEASADVAARVAKARDAQTARGGLNRHLAREQSQETPAAKALVAAAVGSGVLTARGGDRVRRVARTIADLAGLDQVGEDHTAEAIGLRGDWRDD